MISASPSSQASLQKPLAKTNASISNAPFSVLTMILESFSDGVLLLTTQGECLHINQQGRRLCRLLNAAGGVPSEVWALCSKLIEGRTLLPDVNLVLSDTATAAEGATPLAIRAQWIELGDYDEPCVLVMLEDQAQTAKVSALLESRQFNLTARETEVWLLRKANYTYEEIASRLYIALNTVKRHLKSIYAKRKQVLEELEA